MRHCLDAGEMLLFVVERQVFLLVGCYRRGYLQMQKAQCGQRGGGKAEKEFTVLSFSCLNMRREFYFTNTRSLSHVSRQAHPRRLPIPLPKAFRAVRSLPHRLPLLTQGPRACPRPSSHPLALPWRKLALCWASCHCRFRTKQLPCLSPSCQGPAQPPQGALDSHSRGQGKRGLLLPNQLRDARNRPSSHCSCSSGKYFQEMTQNTAACHGRFRSGKDHDGTINTSGDGLPGSQLPSVPSLTAVATMRLLPPLNTTRQLLLPG